MTITVGTSQTDSTTFENTTSITVGANVGAEMDGASIGGVSASYTQTFSLTKSTSQTNDTQVQWQQAVNFPSQPTTWVWAGQTQIAVFRSDGSQLDQVTYSNQDQRFVPKGATLVGGNPPNVR